MSDQVTITYRPAQPSDLLAIIELLGSLGLPLAGVEQLLANAGLIPDNLFYRNQAIWIAAPKIKSMISTSRIIFTLVFISIIGLATQCLAQTKVEITTDSIVDLSSETPTHLSTWIATDK